MLGTDQQMNGACVQSSNNVVEQMAAVAACLPSVPPPAPLPGRHQQLPAHSKDTPRWRASAAASVSTLSSGQAATSSRCGGGKQAGQAGGRLWACWLKHRHGMLDGDQCRRPACCPCLQPGAAPQTPPACAPRGPAVASSWGAPRRAPASLPAAGAPAGAAPPPPPRAACATGSEPGSAPAQARRGKKVLVRVSSARWHGKQGWQAVQGSAVARRQRRRRRACDRPAAAAAGHAPSGCCSA